MSTQDPGQQQYLPPVQPPSNPTPGYATPGYTMPGYAAPQYNAPNVAYRPGAPGPGEPFDGAVNPADLSRPLYGATFPQAIKRFFGQYANFTGRASRSEFWWVMLFVALVQLVPMILMVIGGVGATLWVSARAISRAGGSSADIAQAMSDSFMLAPTAFLLIIGGILMFIISLALIVPQLAIYWRRLHDVNLAGPLYFLSFIAIGSLIVLIFTLLGPRPQGRRFQSSRG